MHLPARKILVHKSIELKKISKSNLPNVEEWQSRKVSGIKYDDCHAIIIKKDGVVKAFSRQGEPVAGALDHILAPLAGLKDDNFVMFAAAWNNWMEHSKINGAFRRGHKEGEERALWALVFDFVSLQEFENGVSHRPWSARISEARGIVEAAQHAHPFLDGYFNMAFYGTAEECDRIVSEAREEGLLFTTDGLIERDPQAGWIAGAGSEGSILKLKKKMTVDLLVTDIVEGKGKFAGMLGSFVCTYKGKEQLVQGGKCTDDDRKAWFLAPFTIIGTVIEVDALGEFESGLLREPRMSRPRPDKTADEAE